MPLHLVAAHLVTCQKKLAIFRRRHLPHHRMQRRRLAAAPPGGAELREGAKGGDLFEIHHAREDFVQLLDLVLRPGDELQRAQREMVGFLDEFLFVGTARPLQPVGEVDDALEIIGREFERPPVDLDRTWPVEHGDRVTHLTPEADFVRV